MPRPQGISKRKAAYLRSLSRKSLRDKRRRFVAEGVRVVEEALGGRFRVTEIVAAPSADADIERWQSEGRLKDVEISRVDERTFRGLAETVHPQGALAVVEEPLEGLDDLVAEGPVLLLDRLQDPGNAGTLLRTLHAVGGRSAIALSGTVDLFNAKVVRASAGSLFHLRLATRVTAGQAAAWLAERDVALLVLDRGGVSLMEPGWEAPQRVALAVGNEAAGADPVLRASAAAVVSLPMASQVDSLNAAVAGSLALYEWLRRRGSG